MRLLHRSSDGDAWLLVKERSGDVRVEHRTRQGSQARLELGEFLSRHEGPARHELVRLIATLVDESAAGPDTT